MTDYVLKSPSAEAFMQAATALGYVQTLPSGEQVLVLTDNTLDGGSYFINVVGVVYDEAGQPLDGHWTRIRVLNSRPLPEVPPGFTLYPPGVDQPPYGLIF